MSVQPVDDFGPFAFPPPTAAKADLVRRAAHGFADANPKGSARQSFSRRQKYSLLTLFAAFALVSVYTPALAAQSAFAFLCLMAWFNLLFRYGGLVRKLGKPFRFARAQPQADENLPVYTVLVPLFREAEILPGLIAALRALNYPKEKLDIKLLVEEADQPTCKALAALNPGPPFTMVVVPDYAPRTKPKACNYGLFFARGDYITIYDAEDTPDPDQLRLACEHFAAAPESLACLQAILDIDRRKANWLGRQFALEYEVQFCFLFPWLAQSHLPMPLGGTSNHFRTGVLRALKGWDAWNVTEDAELGLRLAMNGYHCGVLPSPTLEEASARYPIWFRQRARWFKGYMQTYLAIMRHYRRLRRTVGWRGFFAINLYFFCLMASILIYPTLLIFPLVHWLAPGWAMPFYIPWVSTVSGPALILVLVLLNLFLLYADPDRKQVWRRIFDALTMPVYWLLHFPALLYAGWQLVADPHRWDKTPHQPRPAADKQ